MALCTVRSVIAESMRRGLFDAVRRPSWIVRRSTSDSWPGAAGPRGYSQNFHQVRWGSARFLAATTSRAWVAQLSAAMLAPAMALR